ncbi:hypothetical protein ACIP93_24860 [Streptomyces sp. NPDC088745]|uniref:hypothetical protein n=1 Tax=Streptomyces sp. NPDC088745 TaxID=3365884 RepID=UPI00380D48C9
MARDTRRAAEWAGAAQREDGGAAGWPPEDGRQWLAVLALGPGPVGGVLCVRDHGTERGDVRLLGALSYVAPLLSTALLVVTGRAGASRPVDAAGALIARGAVLASADMLSSVCRRGVSRTRPP